MFHQHVGAKPPKRPADAAAGGAAPAKRAKTSIDEKRSEIDEKRSEIEHHLETIHIFIHKISKIKGDKPLEKFDETLEKLTALEEELDDIFDGIHEGFNPRYPNCAGCNRPGPLGPAPGQTAHMGSGGCLGSSCDDSSSDEDEPTE